MKICIAAGILWVKPWSSACHHNVLSCQLWVQFDGRNTVLKWSCSFSFITLPESSAARVSVSPYSNSRLGDSMELCEHEQNPHEQRCSTRVSPHTYRHSNILWASHILQHLLYLRSHTHTSPTHTRQALSWFWLLIGCWISRQRWLVIYISSSELL